MPFDMYDKDAYVVTGLLDGPTPNTIDVGPIRCSIESITLDGTVDGVPLVPQGVGAICLQFQDETNRDLIFPFSGSDTVLIIVDSGVTWNPVTEIPPDEANLVADYALVTTSVGSDCSP